MTQLVILEGPDRCGKTTIANYLSSSLSAPSYHFGKPGPTLQSLFGHHYQYKPHISEWAKHDYVILDRSWISGLFYDYHRRQNPAQSYFEDLQVIKSLLSKHNINIQLFLVYREWNLSLIKEHEKELEQDPNSLPKTMVNRFIEHHSWPGFIYNLPFIHPQKTLEIVSNHDSSELSSIEFTATDRFDFLAKPTYRQTAYMHYANLWSSHNWEACKCPGVDVLLQGVPYSCQQSHVKSHQ
jgi:hypothetical protein